MKYKMSKWLLLLAAMMIMAGLAWPLGSDLKAQGGTGIYLPFVSGTTSTGAESSEMPTELPFGELEEGGTETPEVNAAIVGGTVVTAAPSWIVGGLKNGHPHCTGTLIYSRWVISAGHCGALDSVSIGGTFAANGLLIEVEQSFILNSNGGNTDLALHRLSAAVPNQPLEMNRDTNLFSRTPWVQAVGYGSTKVYSNGFQVNDGRLRATPWLNVYTRDGVNSAFEFGNAGQAVGVCSGDSGGPAVGYNGRLVLAGVISYTNGVQCDQGQSGAADISEHMGWIDSTISAYDGGVGGGGISGWSHCATEGAWCSFSGTREVQFGAGIQTRTKVLTGPVLCNNATFAPDPAPGMPKSCSISVSSANDTYMLKSMMSGKCADLGGTKWANGDKLIQYSCTNVAQHKWSFEKQSNGYYLIRNKLSNKCIDISGTKRNNGDKLMQWTCVPSATQHQWSLEKQTTGNYIIRNRLSNKCIDISGTKSNNLDELMQWTCVPSAAQHQWQLIPQ